MTPHKTDIAPLSRGDESPRTTVLSFKVSPAEATRIRRAAKRKGLGVTVYIREATLADVDAPRAA